MSYYGGGGQNGGNRGGAGGNPPQTTLLTGPQLFVNSASQLQFQTGGGQNYFPQGEGSQQSHVQLNTGGGLLLQPPVNFVTDGLGVGISQLITQGSIMNLGNVLMTEGASGQGQGQSKQRVFTGMVTKIHDNFGFIDEEVFFQMGVVKGPILPKEGDRVLVEADYNPSMPFKWNATRVQIVNMGGGSSGGGQVPQQQQQQGGYGGYSSSQKQVPPPPTLSSVGGGGGRQQQQQSSVNIVANPHHSSMYVNSGGGTVRSSGGGMSSGGMESLMGSSGGGGGRLHQDSGMGSGLMGALPPLMPKLESGSGRDRDRDRERKDKSRDGRGGRDARSRSRSRSKERSRRDRSRERVRRSRTKSRERRPRRSPSPPVLIRRSRERTERDRGAVARDRGDRSVDIDRGERARDRERSPAPVKSHKSDRSRVESRVKRSRSRDTIKSSEGKGSSSTHRRDKLSRSISPRRTIDNKSIVVKSASRYCCDPPTFSLDLLELNAADMKSRYKNLYVPSDFFLARASWMEAFPLNKPYQLSLTPSLVQIMGRRVERLEVNFSDDSELVGIQQRFDQVPGLLQAPDSSCTFSVKVMILSAPSLESIFRKSGFVLESDSESSKDITTIGFQTLQRLLNFVVGVKTGKHDIMALGGKWSPSLDGPDPQSNPRVLINTAIRCCKAMASLDLTRCKYWYRFMEIYYRRSNGNLETVVYFLPDLSSCVPAQNEWDIITKAYRVALYGAVAAGGDSSNSEPVVSASSVKQESKKSPPKLDIVDGMDENWETCGGDDEVVQIVPVVAPPVTATAAVDVPQPVEDSTVIDADATSGLPITAIGDGGEKSSTLNRMEVVETDVGERNGDDGMDVSSQESDGVLLIEENPVSNMPAASDVVTIKDGSGADGEIDVSVDIYEDIVEVAGAESNNLNTTKTLTPGTHHSQLDLNCMTVAKLRDELALRNLNTKGLKAQLTSRLQEALDSEKEKEAELPKTSETVTQPVLNETTAVKVEDVEVKNEQDEVAIVRLVHPSTIFETSINEEEEKMGDDLLVQNKVESSEVVQPEEQKDDQSNSVVDKDAEAVMKYIKAKPGGQTYPILTSDMKVEEKKVWERRFALPKAARVLLFPSSKVAASSSSLKKSVSPFDCSVMPLTSLRDYRHMDKREESFEVSLFAEFFYEMLQRDFGFRIYSEIVRQAEIQNSDKGNESDESEAVSTNKDGEPVPKKRKTSSVPAIPGVINTPDEKDSKFKTVDPLLLLAFTFYDENHAGHITDANVEEICSALGLGLTRHEIQKLLAKVSSKGCLHYRSWTDKTETEIDGESEQSLLADESKFNPQFMNRMAKGNKTLLPVFTYSAPIVSIYDEKTPKDEQNKEYQAGKGESVLATVDGVLVDVKRVKHELEIAEKDKVSAEANANAFKNSLTEAKNQVSELKKSNETLTQDLKKARKHVKELEASEKSNKEMLDTFKKSSESFIYRVKDIVKLPHSHSEEKKGSSVTVKKTAKDKDVEACTSSSSSGVNALTENDADKKI